MNAERVGSIVKTAGERADFIGVPSDRKDAYQAAYVEASVTVNKQADDLYEDFTSEVNELVAAYYPGAPATAQKEIDAMVAVLKKVAREAYHAAKVIPRRALRGIFVDALGSVFTIAVAGGVQQAEIDEEFRPEKTVEKAGHEPIDWGS